MYIDVYVYIHSYNQLRSAYAPVIGFCKIPRVVANNFAEPAW